MSTVQETIKKTNWKSSREWFWSDGELYTPDMEHAYSAIEEDCEGDSDEDIKLAYDILNLHTMSFDDMLRNPTPLVIEYIAQMGV